MNKILLFVLLFFLGVQHLLSQVIYPIDQYAGENISLCEGFFVDEGADTLTLYEPGVEYSITFSAENEGDAGLFLRFQFVFFDLGPGDFLSIYDGEDSDAPRLIMAGGNELEGEIIYASTPSLHFVFESTGTEPGFGWWAEIDCFENCDVFTVDVLANGEDNLDFCPILQNVVFTAQPEYLGGDATAQPENFSYEWYFEGEIKTGQEVSHEYENTGAYPFRLTVIDSETLCEFNDTYTVRLATIPDLSRAEASSDTVCAGEDFTLSAFPEAQSWFGFPTVVDTTVFVNSDNAFEDFLLFDVFEESTIIEEVEDFDRVCINMEHVEYGHLRFEVECPSGNAVLLKDYSSGGANLGEPAVFDDDVPGIGYEYCFNVLPELGTMAETPFSFHEYTDAAGSWYFNAPYMPAGNYTAEEDFSGLLGCPLNGEWTVRVFDENEETSGHIRGWSLFFNDKFYPDSLIFTPVLEEVKWLTSTGSPLNGNPVSVSEDEEGVYDYTLQVTDNFGCIWDTIVSVKVLPLPKAEIVSELELPVCEGDSTFFSVVPEFDGDQIHWLYQWLTDGQDWEGRVYDTLMVKEPASYQLRLTDTITGCREFLEKTLTEENCDLTIPNVFTPNADGINDVFEITNLENYPGSHIIIFNRNGRKVFEHNDYYDNWWDGGNHPDGTYFYTLTYERQGKRRHTHGVVMILR